MKLTHLEEAAMKDLVEHRYPGDDELSVATREYVRTLLRLHKPPSAESIKKMEQKFFLEKMDRIYLFFQKERR